MCRDVVQRDRCGSTLTVSLPNCRSSDDRNTRLGIDGIKCNARRPALQMLAMGIA